MGALMGLKTKINPIAPCSYHAQGSRARGDYLAVSILAKKRL